MRHRQRIGEVRRLKPGDLYRGVLVKATNEMTGAHCPTKAYYDNGVTVQNTDKVLRIVLENGFIHYIKL
jgi:hypothetical protein